MGLANFLYGEYDAAEAMTEAQDALIRACIALESECDGSDAAKAILSGYRRVWVGCAEVASEVGEDYDPGYFNDAADAEQFYRKLYLKAYVATVRRSYPKYETDGDGIGWWPEALPYDRAWPRKLLARLATVMGEAEGERMVAMSRYFEREDAAQQASAND